MAVVRARKAEPQKIVITRDVVNIPPISEKMMDDGIGYVKVEALTKGKSQEIAAKIKSLEKSGAKKVLLDLRNCAEGDESEGVATANLFLNHGTITYLQGQKFPREAFNADPAKAITTLPVAVLVNREPQARLRSWPLRFWRTRAATLSATRRSATAPSRRRLTCPMVAR